MMSRWETMAANLPLIQQRLIALNELHQQGNTFIIGNRIFNFSIFFCLAFQFSTGLSHYEAEQQALKTSLDANDQLLKQVRIEFILSFICLFLFR